MPISAYDKYKKIFQEKKKEKKKMRKKMKLHGNK